MEQQRIHALSDKEVEALRKVIRKSANSSAYEKLSYKREEVPNNAPELYIAKIPDGGIPARTESMGNITPGSAECDIYKIDLLDDDHLVVVEEFTKEVWNITELTIVDEYVLVSRDKWGYWHVLNSSGSLLGKADDHIAAAGEPGTGTGGDPTASGTVSVWEWNGTNLVDSGTNITGYNIHEYRIPKNKLYKWVPVGGKYVCVELASKAWATSLSSALDIGNTTSVTLSDGTEVDGANAFAVKLRSGAVVAVEDAFTKTIMLLGAPEPAPGTITYGLCAEEAGILPGETGTCTKADNSNVEAVNWSKHNRIRYLDKIHLYQDAYNDTWIAISGAYRFYRAQLAETLTPDMTTVDIKNGVDIQTNQSMQILADEGSDMQAINSFGLRGETDDYCFVAESLALGGPKHLLIQVKPSGVSREFLCALTANMLSGDPSGSVGSVQPLDGGEVPDPALTTALNTFDLSGETGAMVLVEEDWTNGSPDYIITQVQHIAKNVVTAIQYASNKLQYKYQPVALLWNGAESDWQDLFTGSLQRLVDDVWYDSSTDYIKMSKKDVYVLGVGTPDPADEGVVHFEQITYVDEVTYNTGTKKLQYNEKTALVLEPGTGTGTTVDIHTMVATTVVENVDDAGTVLLQYTKSIDVWAAASSSPSTIATIDDCGTGTGTGS